jgi:hypothetical protein
VVSDVPRGAGEGDNTRVPAFFGARWYEPTGPQKTTRAAMGRPGGDALTPLQLEVLSTGQATSAAEVASSRLFNRLLV